MAAFLKFVTRAFAAFLNTNFFSSKPDNDQVFQQAPKICLFIITF